MARDLLTTYKYGWKTSYYHNTMDGKVEDVMVEEQPVMDDPFEGNEEAYEHYFEHFEPAFDIKGAEARLSISFPDQRKRNTNFKVSKHTLELNIPMNVMIGLQTRYSSVDIRGFRKGLRVENRSGKVLVNDIK